jgi:hypothetical protein
MLNLSVLIADELGRRLASIYRRAYGGRQPLYAEIIDEAARLVIERIASSDALYHNAEHTAMVALVMQDILRGWRTRREVTPEDWLHMTLAALTHDVGYVRGICRADKPGQCVIDAAGTMISIPRGASDAFLAPYHVERGKIAILERFVPHEVIDAQRLADAIELTRFPIPQDEDYAATDTEAGLVRAADLVGQLGDPLYLRKLNALFHEFSEIGMNETLGYQSPADMAERYPRFFWKRVQPYVADAIVLLEMTIEGRQWVANLYSHVFAIEHSLPTIGPETGK